MLEPKVLGFDEWLKPQEEAEQVDLKCADCDGTGICECHCGDEHDCSTCDGSGRTEDHAKWKEAYQAAVAADQKRWEEWNQAVKIAAGNAQAN